MEQLMEAVEDCGFDASIISAPDGKAVTQVHWSCYRYGTEQVELNKRNWRNGEHLSDCWLGTSGILEKPARQTLTDLAPLVFGCLHL